ncbi:RHS repeat domain-containing protein [Streptomyces sp. NPDC088729]|uniref:RHS repeat domain-containing protein n=1 Tax=Streptomyces sp. NPDC088729 TaxID=3365876 RepID=UPI0037F8DDCB
MKPTTTSGATGSKLNFLAADHHGTSSIATDATTQAVTKRHSTPFGAPRGAKPTAWPDDKAFLGKPADAATGLTHIGARAYDPGTGQFISVDPLLELDKHQTLNGYSYSINNPLTFSDPTGMGLACGGAGGAGEGCPSGPGGSKGNGRPKYINTTTPESSKGGTARLGGGAASAPTTLFPRMRGVQPVPYFDLDAQSWNSLGYNFPSNPADDYGILYEGDVNSWETSRALFFGWILGAGNPLQVVEEFRGGAVFTAKLSRHQTIRSLRSALLRQAVDEGVEAAAAKNAVAAEYRDKGPEPGSPWYRFNSIRGAAADISGVLSNGKVGTQNEAAAFLGSYRATGIIRSVNRNKGHVVLEFSAWNLSDWRSATHLVPREINPYVTGLPGAAVEQRFSWREKLPLSSCGCWAY